MEKYYAYRLFIDEQLYNRDGSRYLDESTAKMRLSRIRVDTARMLRVRGIPAIDMRIGGYLILKGEQMSNATINHIIAVASQEMIPLGIAPVADSKLIREGARELEARLSQFITFK